MNWNDRQYLIAFNMVPGIGGIRLRALWRHFGSLKGAWEAAPHLLRRIAGIGPKTARAVEKARHEVCPETEEAWARSLGAEIITIVEEGYPGRLKRLAVPPPVLYVLGTLPKEPAVAIVGTRRPSRSGIAQARLFSGAAVAAGRTVVSGLARGIDYFAHREAVQRGGKTVAVLGSNLADLYPAEHRGLVNKIAARGAVISEFSSRCSTLPGNFPRRNRIIAGLAQGVLVVQAGAKSGTISTADWALELGLDVWAIPGEISDPLREGCHNLIKQGAYLVTSPADLWGEKPTAAGEGLSVAAMFAAGRGANEIAAALELPIAEVLAQITRLEIGGS